MITRAPFTHLILFVFFLTFACKDIIRLIWPGNKTLDHLNWVLITLILSGTFSLVWGLLELCTFIRILNARRLGCHENFWSTTASWGVYDWPLSLRIQVIKGIIKSFTDLNLLPDRLHRVLGTSLAAINWRRNLQLWVYRHLTRSWLSSALDPWDDRRAHNCFTPCY